MPLDAASSWTEPAAPVHGWGHESRGTPAQPDGTGLPRGHRTGRPADDPAGPYPGRPRRAALQHRVSRRPDSGDQHRGAAPSSVARWRGDRAPTADNLPPRPQPSSQRVRPSDRGRHGGAGRGVLAEIERPGRHRERSARAARLVGEHHGPERRPREPVEAIRVHGQRLPR